MVRIASGLGAARVFATLAVGACAGAALTTHLGAQAQDGSAAAVAALEARVAALEKKIDAPKEAPFSVVGANGETIFSVTEGGDGASLKLGTSGSGVISLSSAGDELELTLAKGNSIIRLAAASEGPILNVGGAGGSVVIKQTGDAPSITMTQGGEPVFKVDTAEGGPQITVQKGAQVVQMTAIPNQTGIYTSANDSVFQMGDFESVRGFVASKGGIPLAALGAANSDKYRVVIYNGGAKPVFTGGYDGDAGKLGMFLGNESGQNIATITAAQGGGGELKLMPPGGEAIVTLGPTEGGNGGALKLGAGENGLVAKSSGDNATIIAKIGGKIAEMGITPTSTGFVVGSDSKPLAALVDRGDGKPFLGIYGSGSSSPVAKVSAIGDRGSLMLNEGGKPMASLGPTEQNANPAVRIFNKGNMVFAAGATPNGDGAAVVLSGGSVRAGFEAQGTNGRAYVYAGGQEVASINSTDSAGEGMVVVRSKSGVAVATLGYGKNGGGNVTTADPSGSGVFSAGYIGGDGPGAACVDHKGTKCLGIGLTGMEGFH